MSFRVSAGFALLVFSGTTCTTAADWPLHPAGIGPAWRTYHWDQNAYEQVRNQRHLQWRDVALSAEHIVDLTLEQFEVVADDADLLLGDAGMDRPDVVLLRGTVEGEADSRIFLALSPHGSNGFIQIEDRRWIIATRPQAGSPTVMYDEQQLPHGLLDIRPLSCGTDLLPMGGMIQPLIQPLGATGIAAVNSRTASQSSGAGNAGGGKDDPTCRVLRLAIETDYEYSLVFAGNAPAAQAYATTLIGAVSEIYRIDLNTRLEIGFLRVWPNNGDPYNAGTIDARLHQFRDHWNGHMGHVNRNIAHMLSGLTWGSGGAAWVGVVCDASNGYGISGYMFGSFPTPLAHNNQQNWDPMIVAHEIGHNVGAIHTHDMSPPVDSCGLSNCSGAHMGTLMSYCDVCPGGIANIRMEFHTRVISERILPYLATVSCSLLRTEATVLTHPEPRHVKPGAQAQFSVQGGGSGNLTYQWRRNGAPLVSSPRISGVDTPALTIDDVTESDAGSYDVVISNACGSVTSNPALLTVESTCYANCDGSTTPPVLNVEDFTCFINEFAAAQSLPHEQQLTHYANCDASTTPPVLNVEDFTCFINRFAAGCP